MPFKIMFDPEGETALDVGTNFPVVICDHCGERIENARRGMYLIAKDANQPGNLTDPLFAHQGPCFDALSKSTGRTAWHHLQNFIIYFCNSNQLGELLKGKK